MLVQVQWMNKMYDFVPDFMLDDLIEAGSVLRFLRASGWAVIGEDPVRARDPEKDYPGADRRGATQDEPELDEVELELVKFLHCGSSY